MHTKDHLKKVLAQTDKLGERPHRIADHDSHGFDGQDSDFGSAPRSSKGGSATAKAFVVVRERNENGRLVTKIKRQKPKV